MLCECVYLLNAASIGGNLRPEIGTFLGDGSGDGRSLHLALVVDDNAGVVLEVDEDTILPAKWLALPNDDGRHHLLAQLGLALLHRGHEHVASTGGGQTVQATLDAIDGDHEQVLGASVVGTVDNSAHGKTKRDAKLSASGTTTT